jgi:hypothetical protein
MLLLGDLHGCWDHTNIVIADAMHHFDDITHIIQLGDFGYGWPGITPLKFSRSFLDDEQIDKLDNDIQCLFLDGNHENFSKLNDDNGAWQPGWKYMSRGSVLEIPNEDGEVIRVMFYGGATSPDMYHRTPYVSWWPQEAISYGATRRVIAETKGPIHALFSHDHPKSVPYSDNKYGPNNKIGESDRTSLEAIRQAFKPQWSFFGHHHKGNYGIVDGMQWTCCPIIDSRAWTIWDGENIIKNW